MTHFVQLHLLTSYAASNLNRDDTGRPKTLSYGGASRLRVSSQSLKRAFRTSDVFADALPDALGKRSIDFARGLIDALSDKGKTPEDAQKLAEKIIETGKLGKVKPAKESKDRGKTEQLVHLAPEELAAITALADTLADMDEKDITDKTINVLKKNPRAVDIAMFGRMLASDPGFNVEAAVQVAHAFTTHRVTIEDDFYTAVDDIKNANQDKDRGAGFLGVHEYGAGLFYLYICINLDQLLGNLAGDRALTATALKAFIRAATTVSPTGKQNSYASRARASYALMELGDETPRSLAAAFQTPIGQTSIGLNRENDYLAASIKRLNTLREGFKGAYGENLTDLMMDVTDPKTKTLNDLIAAAVNYIPDHAG